MKGVVYFLANKMKYDQKECSKIFVGKNWIHSYPVIKFTSDILFMQLGITSQKFLVKYIKNQPALQFNLIITFNYPDIPKLKMKYIASISFTDNLRFIQGLLVHKRCPSQHTAIIYLDFRSFRASEKWHLNSCSQRYGRNQSFSCRLLHITLLVLPH